jgi:tetratricopeptide (TPR) repeat protein
MRKGVIGYILIALLAGSCNKSIVPSSGARIGKQETDARYDYYYVEGIRNKLTGSPAGAIALFEECIKVNPARDGAYFQIAQIAYASGNMPQAMEFGKKALARSKNLWHFMLVANVHFQNGNIDSAIIVYQEAQALFPEAEELRFTLGNLYFQAGRYEQAIGVFNYFDEKYGMAGNSAIPLVRSLIGLERYDEAEAKLLQMNELYPEENTYTGLLAEMYRDKGDFGKAAEIYEKLLSENPDDTRVLHSLVGFFRKENNYRELFGLMNSIAMKEGMSVEEKVNLFASLLDDQEVVKNYAGEYEMSLMILEAAHTDVAIAHLLKPEIYELTGRKIEAIESLELFLLKWPDNYYAWEKILLLYIGTSDYEKLYAASTTAVRRFNTAILPRLLNAAASVEIGFYDEALEQLQRVRRLSNENKELILQILTTEADAYYRKGMAEEAFAKYAEALKLSPDDNLVLNNYAYFLAEKDVRLKDALKMINQVIDSEPTNNTYLDTQAWVYYKLKKYRRAEAVMRMIVESDDNGNAEYFEHYGFILKALKRCEEAVMAWTKAIELDDSKEKLKEEIDGCIGKR